MNLGRVDHLIVLVGHNPMPLYISVAALKPDEVHWVYSDDTRACKDDLIGVIREKWPHINHVDRYYIREAHSPRCVAEVMSVLPHGAALNYTGGTKVMTVHAHAYWMKYLDGRPDRSVYVDGKNGFLRLDDGQDLPLCSFTFSLSVDDVIRIHGLKRKDSKAKSDGNSGIRPEHWRSLARWAVDYPENVLHLYECCKELRDNPRKAKNTPVDLRFIPLEYLPDFTTRENWPVGFSRSTVKAWGYFLTGGWLEDFMEEIVNDVSQKHDLGLTVASGVQPASRELEKNNDSELDVLAVKDYHVCLVSCTTSIREGKIKPKCYEALNRVQLVGGGLARAAVVCLASPEKALYVEKRARIGWQGDDGTVKVFNCEDVRNWLNGDFRKLLEWLE